MGWFVFFISAFLLYKWFGNPNYIGSASWYEREDEIRTNKWIVIATTAFVGILSIPYWMLYQLNPNISYFWYLVIVIGGGIYLFLNWIDPKPK